MYAHSITLFLLASWSLSFNLILLEQHHHGGFLKYLSGRGHRSCGFADVTPGVASPIYPGYPWNLDGYVGVQRRFYMGLLKAFRPNKNKKVATRNSAAKQHGRGSIQAPHPPDYAKIIEHHHESSSVSREPSLFRECAKAWDS